MDRAAVRPAPRVRDAPLDRGADRPRPARDRRRGLGEADVGRAEPHRRRTSRARQQRRNRHAVVSARARPRGRAAVAVRRAARRRDPPPAASARSAGRPTDRRRRGERVCLLDVPTNKTATAFTKPVDRLVGDAIEAWQTVRPAQPEVPGPQDRRAGRHAARLPRRAARREVHQPGAGPAAVPQGRRAARGRPRRDHRPSRPRDDRHPALQRQGPDVAVRAAGLARALIAAAPPSTTRGSPRSR